MGSREEDRKVPLLGPRPLAPAAEHGENSVTRGGDAEEEVVLGRLLLEENQKLWKVAGPAICTRFSGFGTTIISLAFIGHIGATELAAFALVSTVLMRFCNGILVSYKVVAWWHCTSSGKFHMLGIYLQRSWIILSSCAVLMLPLFLFTEPLLVFIGQDPKIAVVAGLISLWYIPIMFANLCNFTLQMYRQVPAWACWGHDLHGRCLVDTRDWAAHLCVLWCVPSHVDGVLLRGTHRPLSHPKALSILWCDDRDGLRRRRLADAGESPRLRQIRRPAAPPAADRRLLSPLDFSSEHPSAPGWVEAPRPASSTDQQHPSAAAVALPSNLKGPKRAYLCGPLLVNE